MIIRRKTSLATPTSGTTSDIKFELQKCLDNSICQEAIDEGTNEELANKPNNEEPNFPTETFDLMQQNDEGFLCKQVSKICEEDEDLTENEPTFQCLKPILVEAKVLTPEVHTPKQQNFARFFDVKEIGKF